MSDEEDAYGDEESISFIGHRNSPPEIALDFSETMWEVDLYFSSTIAPFVVNADTEEGAISAAIAKAKAAGIKTIQVERIESWKLEGLDG